MGDSAIDVHAVPDLAGAAAIETGAGLEPPLSCALCCAAADQPAVARGLPAIAAMGVSAFIVPGIEADLSAFDDALSRSADGGLVVLCRSAAINTVQAHRIAAAFTRRRQPFQQYLVLELDATRPTTIAAPIRRALAGLRRRLSVPAEVSNPAMRVSGEQPWICGAMEGDDEPPPHLDHGATVVLEGGLRDEVGAIPEEIIFSAISRSRPLLSLVAEPDDAAETGANDCPTLEIEPLDAPSPGPSHASPPAPSRAGALGRFWPVLVAAAGALAACIALATGDPPPVPPRRPAPQTSVSVPGLALVRTSPPGDTSPTVSALPRRQGPADVIAAPVRQAAPSAARAMPHPLARAVEQGRVTALRGVFATRPYVTQSDWRRAANRCRSRSVDGVRGWRLPRPAELRALWRANEVRDAVYWSGARAMRAASPSNWALDGTTGVSIKLEKAGGAATMCVRSRPSSEETDGQPL